MDIYCKQKDLFFKNLLILELDVTAVEKEYRVKCDKDMFSLPNQQMFEVVTYFLFEKLNEVSEKEKYNLLWPLIDRDQHRQFLKTSVTYLSSIAQESNIRFPRVVPSVISTFSGDRFYEIYLAFSAHVVEKTIRYNDNVSLLLRPSVSKSNSQDVVETLQIATILAGEKFQEIQQFSLKSFEFSLKTSKNFLEHIQKLRSSLATNSSLLEEKNKFLESLFFCESDVNGKSLQYSIGKIFERSKKVVKYWKQLQTFLDKEKKFWNFIFPAIKENPEVIMLDAVDLNLDVNDSVREHFPELNEICTAKSQEKVCLLKYLKVYCIFFELYEKMLIKGDLAQIKELSNVDKTWSYESNLKELKTLHEKLLTTLVNIKENNKVLQDKLFLEEASEDLQNFTKECSSWNFSSKSFQDEINTSRLIFTDKIKDDVLKTSLFSKDSGIESGNDDASCSSATGFSSAAQNTPHPESLSLASAVAPKADLSSKTDEVFESINKKQPTNILDVRRKGNLKSVNLPVPDLALPSGTDREENSETTYSLCTPALVFDIDLEYHRTRQVRESWLSEEQLDSVTLPETSFLD